jgi:hypothetical protein
MRFILAGGQPDMTIPKELRQARAAGADRIYGQDVPSCVHRPERYLLTALDGCGHVYFRRTLSWESYCAAVVCWHGLDNSRIVGQPISLESR